MPRIGVSYDQVAAVADALVSEEISPTLKSVRERLGTGSGTTIHRHLTTWRENRPHVSAATTELPTQILHAFSQEIERSKAEARAEIEDRLVIVQAEAAELSMIGEKLEADLETLTEELGVMTTDRNMLLGKLQEQAAEMELLTREKERERCSAEQARIEVAQLRNKLDIQTEKLIELSTTNENLSSEISSESQARISAEKEAAVLVGKLESNQEKTKALLLEKDALTALVDTERQSAEAARIEVAKIAHELELQSVTLKGEISKLNELTGSYQTEKTARIAAETKIAVLSAALKRKVSELSEQTELHQTEMNARIAADTKIAVLASRLEELPAVSAEEPFNTGSTGYL